MRVRDPSAHCNLLTEFDRRRQVALGYGSRPRVGEVPEFLRAGISLTVDAACGAMFNALCRRALRNTPVAAAMLQSLRGVAISAETGEKVPRRERLREKGRARPYWL